MRTPWSPEEDEKLIKLADKGLFPKEINKKNLMEGRSIQSLKARFRKLELTSSKWESWQNDDLWYVWILIKQGYRNGEISEMIDRGKSSVTARIAKEGLFYHTPQGTPPEKYKDIVNELLGADSK